MPYIYWLLFAAAIWGMPPNAKAGTSASPDNALFGDREDLTGIYFSNFENAVFYVCSAEDPQCRNWSVGEAYGLLCETNTCQQLGTGTRNVRTTDTTVWLKVKMVGRKSIAKNKPNFLGDPGQAIQVEQIESVEVFPAS